MPTTKILVVEDERIIALDIQSSLQYFGYPKPLLAYSGEEALQTAAQTQPDLVLMDIKLNSGMDGVAAAEQLSHRFNLPVVFLTSYADEATLQRAKQAASYGYLIKPFEGRELHTTIQVALHRHHLEHRLRESETYLAAILSSMGEAVIATDDLGRIKFINPLAEKLTGWSQAEALGNPAYEIYRTLDNPYAALRPNQIGCILMGEHKIGQWQPAFLTTRAGIILPIEENATLLRNESGNVTGVVLIFRDISERQRTEAELNQRNRELGLLNRLIFAAVQTAKPEFILNTVCHELAQTYELPLALSLLLSDDNATATVVGEYRSGEERGGLTQTLTIAQHPFLAHLLTDQSPLLVKNMQEVAINPPLTHWLSHPSVNAWLFFPLLVENKVVSYLILGAAEADNLSGAFTTLVWNVADQVSHSISRARLAQIQQRLTTAIEQAAESIVISDSEGTIIYVNPAFEQVTGYSTPEAIGQNCRMVKSGQHAPAFYDRMWRTIKGGEVWRGQFINQKKDGTLFTEETTISPIRDTHGEITHYVAVKHDVTHQLELEEQYRQAQKMEAIGLLAAGIAHDFNNLLTAINGFAELLYTESEPESAAKDMSASILRSGKRAADLVRQLLAFSRKQMVRPVVLNLNNAMTDIEKILRRIIGEQIQIKTKLAENLWPIKADPSQLDQIILNLAVNARDAMPAGGLLTIETQNITIDAANHPARLEVQPGQYVQLIISDTGVGMSQAVQARIFEPFFTTKEFGQGTGLGLAAVYGAVKQNGGHIWVSSQEGVGTAFNIYWPSSEALLPAPLFQAPLYNSHQGQETILLVEDEPSVRELAAHILQEQGYVVLEAINGQAALRLAQERTQKIHLLLTDMIMPGLTGKELADQLTLLQPDLKILFISGYIESTFSYQSALKTHHPVLSKPFSPAVLTRKVREILDNKTADR